ncbi:MAG: dethiobiotin synthase [Gammaproteobacteria bacterium]|nr:dethiobiotin synthase [Gammaproteobacteria bacterium]
MPPRTLFVTATGTDVGKTFVTTALIDLLRADGRRVAALKPVATGFEPEAAAASDSGLLLRALGRPLDPASLDAVSPWRFAAPLSPDMAAAREGRGIDFDALVDFCRVPRDADALLIEGIGGVMVPLDARRTVLDLIAAVGAPSLLIAGSYLGTLSHTLTAAGMLAARGCALSGIAVSESQDQPVPAEETAATLRRFVPDAPVIVVPRQGRAGAAPLPAAELLALFD